MNDKLRESQSLRAQILNGWWVNKSYVSEWQVLAS